MNIASVAAQQNRAASSPTGASPTGASPTGADGKTALGSLSGNFNNFLKMLMTQLQNQDPTSPMDTNQFTQELVQFSSVEQQITTNTSLTKLIELTQASEVIQASSMVGRQVTVAADHVPLQGGRGMVQFTTPAAQPVQIGIFTESGRKLTDVSVSAQKGVNNWAWDGKDSTGKQLPDGAYKLAVIGADSAGKATAVPFNVVGTATGVESENNTVRLRLGGLSVNFNTVRSVGG